jgi:hypothetical protein
LETTPNTRNKIQTTEAVSKKKKEKDIQSV